MRRPKRESVQKMFGFCALFDLGDWKNHVKSAMIKVNLARKIKFTRTGWFVRQHDPSSPRSPR
ncbi:hypothetical protein, partial [Exiguobacterium sp. 8A]|uniref:hypothetical protein n=1 Tax=Exiguobacterium sp. 8A TaxID=2653139 RepID=UPI001F2478D4